VPDTHDLRGRLRAARSGPAPAWLTPAQGEPLRSDEQMLAVCAALAPRPLGFDCAGDHLLIRSGALQQRVDGVAQVRVHLTVRPDRAVAQWPGLAWQVVQASWPRGPAGPASGKVVFDGARPGSVNGLEEAIAAFNQAARQSHGARDPHGSHEWFSVDHEPDLNVVLDTLSRGEVAMALGRLRRHQGI
jgi:hypothetical protein